ncbi:MAG: ABC-F family ATP-binding cassette domain-containing protein, partial [Christensenellaceae bacterium]|nr:ABC-F family ATP-binding cassette domain-containing protein [Christensenellaceae bacterium]
MTILSANNISVSFGVQKILENVTFSVEEGDKIGLLGVNGAGKTTLFKVITGELQPDAGDRMLTKGTTIAYMQQHAEFSSEKTVWEETLSVFDECMRLEQSIAKAQAALEADPTEQNIA